MHIFLIIALKANGLYSIFCHHCTVPATPDLGKVSVKQLLFFIKFASLYFYTNSESSQSSTVGGSGYAI